MGSTPSLLHKVVSIMSKNNLARWYSDCAAAPKPAEMGLIPLRVTKYIKY